LNGQEGDEEEHQLAVHRYLLTFNESR